MNIGFIYAMPGYTQQPYFISKTDKATFIAAAVNIETREDAVKVAKDLYENYKVYILELCGGLANAHLVSKVKAAVGDKIPVGAVFYGPESRRPLVDLLNL